MGGKSGGDPKMIVTRYYLSGHWGICQKVDLIREISIGEKIIWKGVAKNNGTINVAREGLFGGMKKEGGAKGGIDIMLGGDTQVPSPNLVSRLKVGLSNVPGFKGITSLVFHGGAYGDNQVYGDTISGDGGSDYGTTGKTLFGMDLSFFAQLAYRSSAFYWGTQPYLKPLWVTAQRIPAKELSYGTAAIPRVDQEYLAFQESFNNGVNGYTNWPFPLATDPGDPYEHFYEVDGYLGKGIRIGPIPENQYATHPSLYRSLPAPASLYRVEIYVRLDSIESEDNGLIVLRDVDKNSVFGFNPCRDADVDSLRRPTTGFVDQPGNPGNPIGNGPLEIGVWYRFTAEYDSTQNIFEAWITRTDNEEEFGRVSIPIAQRSPIATVHLEADAGGGRAAGSSTWDEISIILGDPIFDANPSHVIYECLTDTDWGMGEDPLNIDEDSFRVASQTLFEEAFGVFLQWQQQSTIEDFVNNVLDHIQGAIFPHPRTGKITLRLLRDDLDLPNLKVINPNNARLSNFSRKGWGETVNEIVVTWTNPDTEKEETVRAQSLANIAQQGGIISSSKNYHGVRTPSLAQHLADRDLREESSPLCSCEVEVNRRFWDITPFEGVKVTWPEFGLNELVMRVMKVNYGDSESSIIRLSLMEDVFSLPLASYVPPVTGEWEDPAAPPTSVVKSRFMPLPAYVLSQYGISLDTLTYPDTGIAPMAVNPTLSDGASYDVLEEVPTASGNTSWDQVLGNVPFMSTAELSLELAPAVQSLISLDNLFGEPPQVEDILIIGGDDLPDAELELALVVSLDATSGNPNILRGVLDTVPALWSAGTKVAISRDFHWRPIPKTYVDGQSVSLKFLTSTSSGMLEEYETSAITQPAISRGVHPTRPGNLKAFNELWPNDTFYPDYPVQITWSHRNRLLEDAVMLAWDESGIPLESGASYRILIEAIQVDNTIDGVILDQNISGESYLLESTSIPPALAGSPFIKVSLWTIRDGIPSWQASTIKFRGPFQEPYELVGEYRDPVNPQNVKAQIS